MTLPLQIALGITGLALLAVLIFIPAHRHVTRGWVDGWQEPKDKEERND